MSSLARTIGRRIIDNTKTQGRPMTEVESRTVIGIGLYYGNTEVLHEKMKQSFIYAILDSRIEQMFGGDICPLAKTFVAGLTGGNPGNAVLYAAVMCELSEGGTRRVEITDMINAFPYNVPSDKVLSSAWDSQKGMTGPDGDRVDNALDHKWAWTDNA